MDSDREHFFGRFAPQKNIIDRSSRTYKLLGPWAEARGQKTKVFKSINNNDRNTWGFLSENSLKKFGSAFQSCTWNLRMHYGFES